MQIKTLITKIFRDFTVHKDSKSVSRLCFLCSMFTLLLYQGCITLVFIPTTVIQSWQHLLALWKLLLVLLCLRDFVFCFMWQYFLIGLFIILQSCLEIPQPQIGLLYQSSVRNTVNKIPTYFSNFYFLKIYILRKNLMWLCELVSLKSILQ